MGFGFYLFPKRFHVNQMYRNFRAWILFLKLTSGPIFLTLHVACSLIRGSVLDWAGRPSKFLFILNQVGKDINRIGNVQIWSSRGSFCILGCSDVSCFTWKYEYQSYFLLTWQVKGTTGTLPCVCLWCTQVWLWCNWGPNIQKCVYVTEVGDLIKEKSAEKIISLCLKAYFLDEWSIIHV